MNIKSIWTFLTAIISVIRGKEVDRIYLLAVFRSVARSFVRLFIPAFLMAQGFSMVQIVLNYYLVLYLCWIWISFPCIWIIQKYGPKVGFVIGIVFSLLDIWLTFHLLKVGVPLSAAAIVYALAEAFFWTSYHVFFVQVTHNEVLTRSNSSLKDDESDSKRGRVLSIVRVCSKIGGIIGPFIGGLLLSGLQINLLLFLSSIILFISILPLLLLEYSPNTAPRNVSTAPLLPVTKPKAVFQTLTDNSSIYDHTRDFIAIFANGFDKALGVTIWPFYCAMKFFHSNFSIMGTWKSNMVILSLLLTLIIGKLVDSKYRRQVLLVSTVCNAFTWFFRYLAGETWIVGLTDIVYGWSSSITNISFNATNYDKFEPNLITKYILIQELASGCGHFIAWMAVYFIDPQLQYGGIFCLGILSSLAQSLMVPEKKLIEQSSN